MLFSSQDILDDTPTPSLVYTRKCNFAVAYNAIAWYSTKDIFDNALTLVHFHSKIKCNYT
jgi:hypothetical protein